MEDSLELPDNDEVLDLLSPPPQNRDSRENTPPHSLAYSNSTCAKDKMRQIQMRSPMAFDQIMPISGSPNKVGVIKTNNENFPLNEQRTVPVSPFKQGELAKMIQNPRDKPVNKAQYRRITPGMKNNSKSPPKTQKISPAEIIKKHQNKPNIMEKQPQQFIQRKTIQKTQTSKLAKRIRQLQQALHMETIISQELRTKLSVTNSLLQSKMKQNGFGYIFTIKNSSRDMKNIDIFIELTTLQRTLTEKTIIIDRLKEQIKQQSLDLEKIKSKKGGSPIVRSPNRTLNDELQKLIQEKESLMNYIDQQKATLGRKIEYIAQLEQEINRITDKQAHYVNIQRPKIIKEHSQLKQQNRNLQEQLQKIQMESNLTEMKLKSDNEQMRNQIQILQTNLINKEKVVQQLQTNQRQKQIKQMVNISIQNDDFEREKLVEQLTLLKKERDFFHQQYRKRTEQSAQLYALRLKLSLMEEIHLT